MLLRSLDAAQATILRQEAGLTTLCVAFVCPLLMSDCFAVCVVSVGDSLAYVLSRRHGLREITTGSRDVTTERDIRDAGGALGPVHNGADPELHNLTLSLTLVDHADIVFVTSDGVSDNFDPVVTKIAAPLTDPPADDDEVKGQGSSDGGQRTPDGRPLMTPTERHIYAVKEMERIVHEFELFAESSCSAQELTGIIMQHVLRLTDVKRKVKACHQSISQLVTHDLLEWPKYLTHC